MYPAVKKVTPCENYVLQIDFENGESGFLDIKPILDRGIFRQLKDYQEFKRVKVNFDTIEWDCGLDLDPEYIYEKCKKNEVA